MTRRIKKAKQGDAEAFIQLFESEKQSLWKVAKAVLGVDADAADALQETALKAWRAIPTFKGQSSLSTWLTRILLNTSYDILKKRRQEIPFSSGDYVSEHRAGSSHKDSFGTERQTDSPRILSHLRTEAANEEQMDVRQTLSKLDENDRVILTLFYISDYPIKQIASSLNISEGAARVRLSRARDRFRVIYADDSNANGRDKREGAQL